ncbi:MAG: hypothetical protein IPO66_23220 [Rhodanobacteraceae bacterium]|nr:hypothetical protein [Rhodanobacteraceae bacterium]
MAPTANFQRRGNLDFGYAMSNWPTAPGTLTIDPKLSPLGQPMTASPAIDAGNDVARGETGPGARASWRHSTHRGCAEIEGAHVDIGAYEGERIHYDGAE